jgi:hypothetical protein
VDVLHDAGHGVAIEDRFDIAFIHFHAGIPKEVIEIRVFAVDIDLAIGLAHERGDFPLKFVVDVFDGILRKREDPGSEV